MAAQNAKQIESIDHIPSSELKKGFPPFDRETFASQLVWLVIFFVALYLLVARVAQPRIGGILAARSQRIADDLAEAERKREESDAALAAYEKALADARNRAQLVANETQARLNSELDKARHALEDRLNAKLAEAEKTIAATKAAAMSNVRTIAAETAAAIVQRLIGSTPDAAAVDAAVADALKR
jgi:F-type H+-transporting ATPase subunit b